MRNYTDESYALISIFIESTIESMKTKLTKRLLGYLIKKGYKYCLSKTFFLENKDTNVGIILKPVKKHPQLQKLPSPYDTYLNITEEPLQMTSEAFGAQVFVELSQADFKKFNLSVSI